MSARTASISYGSTAITALHESQTRYSRSLAAGRHVQARPMAEVEVPDEADLLERLEVAVDRREVRARQPAGEAVGDLLGGDRPGAANSASSTRRRADEIRIPRAQGLDGGVHVGRFGGGACVGRSRQPNTDGSRSLDHSQLQVIHFAGERVRRERGSPRRRSTAEAAGERGRDHDAVSSAGLRRREPTAH